MSIHINVGTDNGHTNSGYANHTNIADLYSNHTNTYQNTAHTNTGGSYDNYTHNQYYYYYVYPYYQQKHYNDAYTAYYNATHTNFVHNQYTQVDYTDHVNMGSTAHSNTGYENHVNFYQNRSPGNPGIPGNGSSVYYKSSVTISWTASVNTSDITAVGATIGATPNTYFGIWENNTKIQASGRSWYGAYWNASGIRQSVILKDVYGNATHATEFLAWLQAIPTGSYVAVGTWDEPRNRSESIRTELTSWGFNTLSWAVRSDNSDLGVNDDDGMRSAWAGVCKKKETVYQQDWHKYTVSGTRGNAFTGVSEGIVCATANIPVAIQTITYTLQYAYRTPSGTYGAWTNATTTTGLSYAHNLSSFNSGYIKYRVIGNDGLENSAYVSATEEIRILKYNAPVDWEKANTGIEITATLQNTVASEINKLLGELGAADNVAGVIKGSNVNNEEINDISDKANIASSITKVPLYTEEKFDGDTIYSADLRNIQDFLENI